MIRCATRSAAGTSYRTEQSYVHWIKRFIYFSGKRHPRELGAAEVIASLNYLARDLDVAASTQNQALSALLFLYREVLGTPLPWLDGLAQVRGTQCLMASLMYGAGLRLRECLKLRVKDVDFGYRQIVVRHRNGAKDRVRMLPQRECDLAAGHGEVELPHALGRKYPHALHECAPRASRST